MITDAIFSAITYVVVTTVGLLPSVTSMPEWYEGFELNVLPATAGLMSIPMLGTVITALILALGIKFAWLVFQIFGWVIARIRG